MQGYFIGLSGGVPECPNPRSEVLPKSRILSRDAGKMLGDAPVGVPRIPGKSLDLRWRGGESSSEPYPDPEVKYWSMVA